MAKKQIAPNLYIMDTAKGLKYYIARFNRNGKQIERSLGNVDRISLREAKLNLIRVMDDYKPEQKITSGATFAEILDPAMDAIAVVKVWKNNSSRHQWEQTLRQYALPVIGDVPVDELTRHHILSVLKPVWFEKPQMASRLRMRLEAIIGWAIKEGLRTEANPAVWKGCIEYDLPSFRKVREVEHHSALTANEAREVVAFCLSHPSPVSAAILFGIATASRVKEFRLARREEIVGDVWFVPPVRRKDKKKYPHRVPLSKLAKIALEMAKGDDLIFVNNQGKLISENSPRLKLINIVNKKVTMHGCRSTFRDWCAENSIDPIAAEKALMHATGSEVELSYQRADLLEKRRPIMEKWSDFLMAK